MHSIELENALLIVIKLEKSLVWLLIGSGLERSKDLRAKFN